MGLWQRRLVKRQLCPGQVDRETQIFGSKVWLLDRTLDLVLLGGPVGWVAERQVMRVPGTPVGVCWPLKLCLDVTVLWSMGKTASHGQEADRKELTRGQIQDPRV